MRELLLHEEGPLGVQAVSQYFCGVLNSRSPECQANFSPSGALTAGTYCVFVMWAFQYSHHVQCEQHVRPLISPDVTSKWGCNTDGAALARHLAPVPHTAMQFAILPFACRFGAVVSL